MRYAVGLLVVLTSIGCGRKNDPSGAKAPGDAAPPPVVTNWKPCTSNPYLFQARFPLGDPTERPVFFGNQPRAVRGGADFAVEVYTKETGNEEAYVFGIRSARFRPNTKPAEREETLAILTKNLPPGLSRSEPRAVTWGGQQASETTWSDPAGPTKWVIRHFTTGDAVYIGYVRDLGRLTPAEMNSFFDSFELLRKS